MSHVIWTGSIAFSMVNIPVRIYPATEPHAISFRMLHKDCFTPIKLKKYCEKCKKEIKLKDVVKGFNYKGKEYYVLTQKEINALKKEKTDFIKVTEFVDAGVLKPILFERSYFVVPAQKKEKAFYLFRDALEQTKKIAIGKFVLREKEYLCAIEPFKKGLLLVTLNYAYEIRNIEELEELAGEVKVAAGELALAVELIEKLSQKKFDIGRYEDSFAKGLKELLKKKSKGEKIKLPPIKARVREKNLMKALKKSLKKT